MFAPVMSSGSYQSSGVRLLAGATATGLLPYVLAFFLLSAHFILPGSCFSQPVTTEKAREISSDTLRAVDSTHNDLLADLFDNDTVQVTFVRYGDLHTLRPFDDSLLSPGLRQMDVVRQADVDFFTLGNIGSPAYSPLVRPTERGAFDLGIHGHDLYKITFDNFRLYRPETPYTHVRYATTTGIRDDNVFTGKLSRTFAKNLTVSLDYARFNQVGEFLRDRIRNTTFGVGFEQSHWKNRYKTHLIYTYNQFLREENGGISQYILQGSGSPSGSRLSMPVNIDNGGSKYKDWGILFNNDLALWRGGDSLSRETSDKGVHIGYEISYRQSSGLFYDTNVRTTADTAYYRGLNNDVRGLRNSYLHKVFLNRAYLSAVGKSHNEVNSTNNYLRGGIALERNHLEYLPADTVFTLLRLEGNAHWDLANVAGINAGGYYLLNSLTPIFKMDGNIYGNLGRLVRAEAWLNVSNTAPGYLYNHIHYNSQALYFDEAKNIFHTYFGGRVMLPSLHLEASIHQNIIQNYTYIDHNWQMQQITQAVSVTGIQGKHHLKIGVFHLDNSILWQAGTDGALRVPAWVSHHAAYLEARLFKRKLLINAGLEARYLSQFDRMGYSPAIFNFYNIENGYQSDLLTYDAFISYKVRLLRGFVRVDNINSLYDKRGQYQIAQYPIDGFAIRLGFDWIFNN